MLAIRLGIWLGLVAAIHPAFGAGKQRFFSDDEREAVLRYWAKPGRYTISPPKTGDRFQVRLTPEGSTWLWNYNKARGMGKTVPGSVPAPQNEQQAQWETWIDAKVAHDRWIAQQEADSRNGQSAAVLLEPSDPGSPPADLVKFAGAPPSFANCCEIMQYTVEFAPGETYTFCDNVLMRPRYAYYRFPQGVSKGGTAVRKLPEDELQSLFMKAGISDTEQKVMKAVSLLEGGFGSVNTYDTGFVSVGFIQFACLKDGAGSLGELLLEHKRESPQAFNVDFRRFGLDVTEDGHLVAMNPETGVESTGVDAAKLIINDKRLIAAFSRAGESSPEFQVCQLKVAKERFYPANDALTVNFSGKPTKVKVCDIIRSEAGLATLFDRKVNTGKIEPITSVCNRICSEMGIDSVEDLATCEYEIVRQLRWRVDYLASNDLSHPRNIGLSASRGGKRAAKNPPPKKP